MQIALQKKGEKKKHARTPYERCTANGCTIMCVHNVRVQWAMHIKTPKIPCPFNQVFIVWFCSMCFTMYQLIQKAKVQYQLEGMRLLGCKLTRCRSCMHVMLGACAIIAIVTFWRVVLIRYKKQIFMHGLFWYRYCLLAIYINNVYHFSFRSLVFHFIFCISYGISYCIEWLVNVTCQCDLIVLHVAFCSQPATTGLIC